MPIGEAFKLTAIVFPSMGRWMVLLAVAVARAASADCSEPFVDPGEVLTLHLALARADWDKVRNSPYPGKDCESQYPYVEARFRCGDLEPWITVGLRHKRGDQRGVDAPQKPPLKLDFDRFAADQRWPTPPEARGFAKLSLNNGQANLAGGVLPALLTEGVAWQLMREEAPLASRAAWVRVLVHFEDEGAVEDHGVYLALEDLDRAAMQRRMAKSCGALLRTTTVWCREGMEYDDGPPNAARALGGRVSLDVATWPRTPARARIFR